MLQGKSSSRVGFKLMVFLFNQFFTIIIHTYAFASMPLEVFILLREIVEYYKKDARDARELFSILLHSACHVIVFDMLIKVFASNSMLEHAYYVFVNAKDVRIEVDIMSCNFLLKCLVDANRVGDDDDDDGVSVRCCFEDLRNFGT